VLTFLKCVAKISSSVTSLGTQPPPVAPRTLPQHEYFTPSCAPTSPSTLNARSLTSNGIDDDAKQALHAAAARPTLQLEL